MKSLTINMINSCSEDWDKMSLSERGKFCNLCQKQVIDFSILTDEDIIKLMRNSSINSICGKINKTQLNRNILPQKQRHFFNFRHFILPLLTLKIATSFGKSSTDKRQTEYSHVVNKNLITVASNDTTNNKENVWEIKGQVINEVTKKPVEGVKVESYLGQKTLTDKMGNFTIWVYENKNTKLGREIHFQGPIEYSPTRTTIILNRKKKRKIIVEIHETTESELGGLGINIKKSFWENLFA